MLLVKSKPCKTSLKFHPPILPGAVIVLKGCSAGMSGKAPAPFPPTSKNLGFISGKELSVAHHPFPGCNYTEQDLQGCWIKRPGRENWNSLDADPWGKTQKPGCSSHSPSSGRSKGKIHGQDNKP